MKIRLFTFAFLLSGLMLSNCASVDVKSGKTTSYETQLPRREYSVQSVIWQQNAAEYRALCYQAFNTAKMRLDQYLNTPNATGKKLAIITDIDETVLDNSPYNAKMIITDNDYSQDEWTYWTSLGEARAIPGAANFLNYVKSKNVEVFYVSNRHIREEKGTLANMKKVNFPYADTDHLFLMNETSSKKDRFEKVKETHTVLLYLGDNLSDFSSKFRANSTEERNKLSDELKDNFGHQFIVLPNPMYGDWESKGVYKGKNDWTETQKDSIRKTILRIYK